MSARAGEVVVVGEQMGVHGAEDLPRVHPTGGVVVGGEQSASCTKQLRVHRPGAVWPSCDAPGADKPGGAAGAFGRIQKDILC